MTDTMEWNSGKEGRSYLPGEVSIPPFWIFFLQAVICTSDCSLYPAVSDRVRGRSKGRISRYSHVGLLVYIGHYNISEYSP